MYSAYSLPICCSRGFQELAVKTSGPSIRFLAWLMRDSASARLQRAVVDAQLLAAPA